MEIRNKLYPYPVLAYFSDDYKSGAFDVVIDLSKDGYNICVDFIATLTSAGLKELIQCGQAVYAYHLECAQTGFRQVVLTDTIEKRHKLSNKHIRGRLQICPFIVAMKDIPNYDNVEFHDDYAGYSFDIEAGCVLAVGKQVNADIFTEIDDFADIPSIFSVVRNADASVKQMLVDMYSQKIVIKLPLNDYYSFKQLNKAPVTQAILRSLIIIPSLVYVLEELRSKEIPEREEFHVYSWYRSISKKLLKDFDCNIECDEFDQNNMLELAQKLINDPLSDAFEILTGGFGTTGEEEE